MSGISRPWALILASFSFCWVTLSANLFCFYSVLISSFGQFTMLSSGKVVGISEANQACPILYPANFDFFLCVEIIGFSLGFSFCQDFVVCPSRTMLNWCRLWFSFSILLDFPLWFSFCRSGFCWASLFDDVEFSFGRFILSIGIFWSKSMLVVLFFLFRITC